METSSDASELNSVDNGLTKTNNLKNDIDRNILPEIPSKVETENKESKSDESYVYVKPVAFCRFIVNRPKVALGITGGLNFLVVLISAILVGAGYDLLPINFSSLPLDITQDSTFLRVKAWLNKDDGGDILRNSAGIGGERTNILDNLNIIYQAENIFTRENLKTIADFEAKIIAVENYGNFCRLNPVNSKCRQPLSIVRFFDGTFGMDPNYTDIVGTLATAQNIPKLEETLQFFLGKDAVINRTTNTATTSITRTAIFFGYPLAGYDGVTGDFDAQSTLTKNFLAGKILEILQEASDNGLSGIKIYYRSGLLFQHIIQAQVIKDLLLALGSFIFIFLFVMIQTQSLFLTYMAVTGIMISFLTTNLIYRIILDYRYFGIFHVLSIFIVLGIGSDDVFILNDTWRATAHVKYANLVDRLSVCYRHASKAMFITSLTTFIAFTANAFNPMLAISSFGIFSGILIMVNYLSAIIYFPCVIIVYHKYFEKWTWPCCRCKNKSVKPVADNVYDGKRKNAIVRFFRGPFFEFVTHKIIRWILLLCMVTLIIFVLYNATTITPQEEQTKILKDSNQLQISAELSATAFRPSSDDRVIVVYIVWGLKEQDLSSCHISNTKCKGTTVWDEGFDLNPKPAQIALLNLCQKIRDMSDEDVENLKIRRNTVTGKLEINCFLDKLDTYLIDEGNSSLYNPKIDLSLPTSETKMENFITSHPELYNITVSPTFYRYFETGVSYWLNDGFSGKISYDFLTYNDLIGQINDTFDTQPVINSSVMYGTRLRYAAVTINTTLKANQLGFQKGLVYVDAWENFVTDEVAKLPPSLSGGFQCTPEFFGAWHWLKVQKVLVESAIQGIIIGISLSLVVLTIATQNFILGFLATLTIVCVTVTVLGIIPLAGWKLGVLESLNLTLVVGLAVDYVVHLADGYHVSTFKDRNGRVRDMLEHVGISILSGACTTLGASFFMLFTEILFFMQFGIFMFCTIGFSLVYSLLFFTVILGICGPQNETGSITPIITWVKNKLTGRKKDDEDCVKCEGRGFHQTFDNLNSNNDKLK